MRLREEMGTIIYERHSEVNGLLLALLTRKHIALIGPAGTAKSLVTRLTTGAIEGARYWERLFTRFTVPEEVFGPVSIAALKADSFRRVTEGHLPEAHVGFADEIFKANSSIQNSLLTIMNERLFHNDGAPTEVPLEVLIGASNEIPTEESLAAFYDRFLLRYVLRYIAEPAHFIDMLKGPQTFREFAARVTARVPLDDLHGAQDEVRDVALPEPVVTGVVTIRQTLAQQGLQPSDRRYKEAMSLVRAKAWLQGRPEAIMDDLAILTDVLWNDPNHRQLVQGVVLEVANPLLKAAEAQHDAVQVAYANVQKVTEKKEKTLAGAEVLSKANEALKALESIRDQGTKAAMDMTTVESHIRAVERIRTQVQRDLGLIK